MADETASTKVCPACKRPLAIGEFSKDARRADGLAFYCKACRRTIRKVSEDVFRDQIREKDRVRSRARPKGVKIAAARKWREANRILAQARSAASRLKKIHEYRAKAQAHKKAFPEKTSAYDANRRARRAGVAGSWSPADVDAVLKAQRGKCAYCRIKLAKPFHRDHIQALSKGGAHDRRNMQLLCKTCNLSKGARDPIDHARSLGLLV